MGVFFSNLEKILHIAYIQIINSPTHAVLSKILTNLAFIQPRLLRISYTEFEIALTCAELRV